MMEFKLAVVGSRTFDDYETLKKVVAPYVLGPLKLEIVSGGASGADALAKRYATEGYINYKEFPADWNNEGKSAGFKRNKEIANYAEYCIAFWDLKSKGTKHTINLFLDQDKPVLIVPFKNKEK